MNRLKKAINKSSLKGGKSYPDAFYSAVKDELGESAAQIFKSPNSTLGIEYIKALFLTALRFTPF